MKKKRPKIAIIAADFNEFITSHMLNSCLNSLKNAKIRENNIKVFKVPGAYEIAPVLSKTIRSKSFDAFICIACIIKGETPHYKYISDHANKAVSKLAIKYEVVVANAMLTCNNLKEAIERAGCKMGNKGGQAAEAVIKTLKVLDSVK
jgi:6,7-dimethyl-8-ribityllumazine synthase